MRQRASQGDGMGIGKRSTGAIGRWAKSLVIPSVPLVIPNQPYREGCDPSCLPVPLAPSLLPSHLPYHLQISIYLRE